MLLKFMDICKLWYRYWHFAFAFLYHHSLMPCFLLPLQQSLSSSYLSPPRTPPLITPPPSPPPTQTVQTEKYIFMYCYYTQYVRLFCHFPHKLLLWLHDVFSCYSTCTSHWAPFLSHCLRSTVTSSMVSSSTVAQ